jgi:hypothetical protein
MLDRGCNNTWGFCSAELKSREYYGESAISGSYGEWSTEMVDVLHRINDKCNDCLGSWDLPDWGQYLQDYVGWKANTYVSISDYNLRYGDTTGVNSPGTGRGVAEVRKHVISLTERPHNAIFGHWIEEYSPTDCKNTDLPTG